MLYPLTAEPLSLAGADQERSMREVSAATAFNPVGASGTLEAVVALSTLDAAPAPFSLSARTL